MLNNLLFYQEVEVVEALIIKYGAGLKDVHTQVIIGILVKVHGML